MENVTRQNFEKLKLFWQKRGMLLLIIILVLFTIWIRSLPGTLEKSEEYARRSIEQGIRQQFNEQVRKEYPNLPSESVNREIERRFQELLRTQQNDFEQEVQRGSTFLQNVHRDDDGAVYLNGIDPYFYLRHARNIVETGVPWESVRDGVPWNDYSFAPTGRSSRAHPFAYTIAYSYLFVTQWFGWSLMKTQFYLPVFVIIIVALVAFFTVYVLTHNKWASFVSGLFMVLAPYILVRTMTGFSDTDTFSILFPMLITFFLALFIVRETKKWKLISGIGFVLSFFVFSLFWEGWWFLADMFIAAYVVYVFVLWKQKNQSYKKHVLYVIGLFIVLFVGIAFLKGIPSAKLLWNGPLTSIRGDESTRITTLFPNVYTTVAELQNVSFKHVFFAVGKWWFWLLALIGMAWLACLRVREKMGILLATFLFFWIISMWYASTTGSRFILLISVPVYLLAGFGISALLTLPFKITNSHNFKIVVIIFSIVLLGSMTTQAIQISQDTFPLFNDFWQQTLYDIRDRTPKDTIIVSWWDFGHFFKYWAERGVVFDGSTQNSPQAHWVGKMLVTNNETEAIGILRMLACGGNKAYEAILQDSGDDELFAKQRIDQIVLLDDYDGVGWEWSHCEKPRPMVLLVSDDMIAKGGVWAHFGRWSFEKAHAWKSYKLNKSWNVPNTRPPLNENEANEFIGSFRGYADTDRGGFVMIQEGLYAAPDLVNSTFTRAMFFDGNGLECFQKIGGVSSGQLTASVFWIDWSCGKEKSGGRE